MLLGARLDSVVVSTPGATATDSASRGVCKVPNRISAGIAASVPQLLLKDVVEMVLGPRISRNVGRQIKKTSIRLQN